MAQILSIQSHVAFGHVGNAAITFPLQTLGHVVWPVPTAILSNHAGYPGTGGARLEPDLVDSVLRGLEARGAMARCDLLLSGYLGSAATGEVVARHVARMREMNAHAVYCCDPVMGDRDSGFYVEDGLRRHFAEQALVSADVLTPNLFELEVLSSLPEGALHGSALCDIAAAARTVVRRMRPGARVLVTSVVASDMSSGAMAMMAADSDEAWLVETPRLAFTSNPHGAGDLASALFAAALVEGYRAREALADMVARLFAVLSVTARSDLPELDLAGARLDLCDPQQRFVTSLVE